MEMEIETKPTKCEVCDNETRHYVRVKFGFGKGDLKEALVVLEKCTS